MKFKCMIRSVYLNVGILGLFEKQYINNNHILILFQYIVQNLNCYRFIL